MLKLILMLIIMKLWVWSKDPPDTCHEVDEEGDDVAQLAKVGEPGWDRLLDDGDDHLRGCKGHHKHVLQQAQQTQQPAAHVTGVNQPCCVCVLS